MNPDANQPTVLLVDDDRELVEMLSGFLAGHALTVRTAGSPALAEPLLKRGGIDLVLLDYMLPGETGMQFLKRMRQQGIEAPVVMLTARGDPIDRVLGLELGADDYVAKPFDPRELLARIRAVLRRTVAQRDATPLASYRFGPFTLDAVARTLNFVRAGQADQEPIDLTSAEFKLLMAFAQNPRQTLSREELTRAVQPGNYEPLARAVDVQIARLRKKLLAAAPEHDLIATVRGEGYVFTPPRG
jgi:DNA-binding response OmpR family regulator